MEVVLHKVLFIFSFCADNCIFSFSFISGVSGTSLFNSVSLMAYNVFYTSVPVLVSVLDKDLSEETVMQHPQILFYCQAGRFEISVLFTLDFLNSSSMSSKDSGNNTLNCTE